MLILKDIRIRPGESEDALCAAAGELRCAPQEILSAALLKKSVDARDKSDVRIVLTLLVQVRDEARCLRSCRRAHRAPPRPQAYRPPAAAKGDRPVVVGLGPAGLFCALVLALGGRPPLILERGCEVDERRARVERFWESGLLDTSCNVQFGEGGAGAFSDGKLNTGLNDVRLDFVMRTLAENGCGEEILWQAQPHAGTDRIALAVKSIRKKLLELGCEIRFGHTVTDISVEKGRIRSLYAENGGQGVQLPCTQAVLAVGHSARDTFEMLLRRGAPMEQKIFSAGVRIEQLQADMNAAQYGDFAREPALPAAGYRLSTRTAAGRGIYSFCVCPGGYVVAAASQSGGVVTNGMSYFDRSGVNINGALLVNVGPGDFPGDALAGMYFQQEMERRAFELGGGSYCAPCQLASDFIGGRPSPGPEGVLPTYRPGVRYCDLRELFPKYITDGLTEGLGEFDRKLRGYAGGGALLTAVESRSSSPVRILRNERRQSEIEGLYPCGEGAGYAGGISSAAIDGIKTAEAILLG